MPQRDVIRKILILRFSSMGDIVVATPLIRCLRKQFPLAQIDCVVREDFVSLIEHNPHLDQKIGLPRSTGLKAVFELISLLKKLNRERYDLILDAHRSLRTLLLMPFLKASRKRYLAKDYFKRTLCLLFKLRTLQDAPRMAERYLMPLKQDGVQWDGKGPELFVSQALAKQVDELMPRGNGLTVGVIASAQWEGKRWPTRRFRQLVEQILLETSHQVVVFGGTSDHFCSEITQGLPKDRVQNLQGKLSLAQSMAWVEKCDFFVSNDTGLMHVADALGKPNVLILGPTAGALGYLPFHKSSVIVERDLWCRPCSKNGQAPCVRRKRFCLLDIQTDDVMAAMRLLVTKLQKAYA